MGQPLRLEMQTHVYVVYMLVISNNKRTHCYVWFVGVRIGMFPCFVAGWVYVPKLTYVCGVASEPKVCVCVCYFVGAICSVFSRGARFLDVVAHEPSLLYPFIHGPWWYSEATTTFADVVLCISG